MVPVMARCTITGDTRVIKNRSSECYIRMANVTILARRQMAVCFSVKISRVRAELTTVTTFTTTGNAWMYIGKKCRRSKTAGISVIVALTAFSQRRDMIDLLRQSNTGVMAGCAIAINYSRIMVKSISECSKGGGVT